MAETVCLGFCHSGPAFRDGDLVDAGEGALERVVGGATRQAGEPDAVAAVGEPVLLAPGDFSGLRHALSELAPLALIERVKEANLRGRGGAGFPAGSKWEFASRASGTPKFVVANADEGDPGSYVDKHLLERNPALLLEGMALAAYAIGAAHGFVYVRSEYPHARRRLDEAIAAAVAAGQLGEDILGSGFSFAVSVVDGAGSYVVGEETALIASLHGFRGAVSSRPPFPAERGYLGRPTVVNNVETLCNVPFIVLRGAEAYAALSPGATPGTKLVCLNERFARPAVYEIPFGISVREICEGLGGGIGTAVAQGGADRGAARGGAPG